MSHPDFMPQMDQTKKILQEVYNQGWADAVANILNAAANKTAPTNHLYGLGGSRTIIKQRPTSYSNSVASRVEALVHAQPGRTGAELVRILQAETPGIKEKAVRTPLYRLKVKGRLRSENEKWYPPK